MAETHLLQRVVFQFFVGSIFDHEKIAESVLEHYPGYPFGTELIENEHGDVCTGMFFPSFQNSQLVQHSMVVNRLEENNDPLDVPRQVDHWCYFRKAEDRAAFLEIIKQEGFQIENLSEDFEQDVWPYGVHMKRDDKVDRKSVFNLTMHLWNLAYKFYGDYDGWEAFVVKE